VLLLRAEVPHINGDLLVKMVRLSPVIQRIIVQLTWILNAIVFATIAFIK